MYSEFFLHSNFRLEKVHFAIFFEIAVFHRVSMQTLLNLKHLVVRFSDNHGLRELLRTKCEDLQRRGGIKASFLMEIQRSLTAHGNMTVARPEYTSSLNSYAVILATLLTIAISCILLFYKWELK